MKKIFNKENLIVLIFFTLLGSAIFTIIRIIFAPTIQPEDMPDVRIKNDYVLMLLQCVVGVIAMIIPTFLSKKINISIPTNMFFVYAIFLYCAIYLGEVRNFYFLIPHWDTMLHTLSGSMLGALGFSVICLLNKADKIPVALSPAFVALFTFCFAIMLGVVWEVYEFSADVILGTNMQKFALESGEQLIGQDALADTMKDLIVDGLGALAISIIGYISLKFEKGWHERLQVKRLTIQEK